MELPNKKICIVGGGTAGWIAARLFLYWKKRFAFSYDVMMIVPKMSAPIGVGEGTLPMFRQVMESGDKISMDDLDATYKFGIHYKNWYTEDESIYNEYWHPFGHPVYWDGYKEMHSRKSPEEPVRMPWETMIETGKDISYEKWHQAIKPHIYDKSWVKEELKSRAYHIDALKLVDTIKKKCESNPDLKLIDGTVQDCTIGQQGIENVILSDNTKIYADLFMDCTGFNRVLISKLENEFIDCSDKLICDRAVVTQINEPNHDMCRFTTATALSAGWSWDIPLQSRTGVGYVYSSKFISDDAAKTELQQSIDFKSNEFEVVKYETKYLKKPMSKNCIALGLSAGFFEPMEATNIALMIMGCRYILDSILDYHDPAGMIRSADALGDGINYPFGLKEEKYNTHMSGDRCGGIVDYLAYHYFYSKRNDTSFWRHVTSDRFKSNYLPTCINLSHKDDKDEIIFNLKKRDGWKPLFGRLSWVCLLAGMNHQFSDRLKD